MNAQSRYLSEATVILAVPRRPALCAGVDNTVEVLLRIQAPDAPAEAAPRSPQAVSLVIDRSGSMAGTPLAEALRCAGFMTSRLRPSDRVSVVQFDHRVQCLLPAQPLGDGEAVRRAVAGIHAGGNTDLHGGWREGARTLQDLPRGGLKRVILLSDGCANAGLVDTPRICDEVARLAAAGVTTSTYGLGRGFNEELMIGMARAGGGSSYYGDTAADLHEPFEREFDLLANLCLTRLTVPALSGSGVSLQGLNDLPTLDGGWRLPDLAWGAEAWLVLRLSVPAAALPAVGASMPLLQGQLRAQTLDGAPVALAPVALALPVVDAAAFDALAQDELVLRRLAELEAARLLARMRLAAAAGQWDEVDATLASARQDLGQHDWLAGMLEAMAALAQGRDRERTMKEAMYSSDKLRSRLASKSEGAAEDAGQASYLKRKRLQGKGDA